MKFHILPQWLLRAPLLPARDLDHATRALLAHSLGPAAVKLGSPDLAAALASTGEARKRALPALDRYARRAAFRPTPSGFLAGVGLGSIGARTAIQTQTARAYLRPSWARLAAFGRALLDDSGAREEVLPQVRLRVTPSLLRQGSELFWVAFEDHVLVNREAAADGRLLAVIEIATTWTTWEAVRRTAGSTGAESDDDLDEYLMTLIGDGLLLHDLEPPIVGPPPMDWMSARLPTRGTVGELARVLDQASAACGAGEVESARVALRALPGANPAEADLHGVLIAAGKAAPMLSRVAVQRAAALAPLLFRLQEAMVPPVSERAMQRALHERIDDITEIFGAGALDLGALATGGYGVDLADPTQDDHPGADSAPAIVAHLVDHVVSAARAGAEQIDLSRDELGDLLPWFDPPPSFELVLAPARNTPRKPPGSGWLLGLHAPAGASFGRFAEALGEPMTAALRALAVLEAQAHPGELALDVVFAAAPGLADLSAHPPIRPSALALTSWPEGTATEVVSIADLELVSDPSAEDALVLRRRGGKVVRPSPLHRVRSTTLPSGLHRLMAGWSFARQHSPWALSWGPLGDLPVLPRVAIDGFVIAPQSWRIPAQADLGSQAAIARWSKAFKVPRHVQVGEGDELMYVDLQSPGARDDLSRASDGRVWAIWPPMDRLADRGGRRVEAVVAVVTSFEGQGGDAVRAARQVAVSRGPVPPPAAFAPAAGWLTFRLFGPAAKQDEVLLDAIADTIAEAHRDSEIDAWFFLRYADPAGLRPHLRVRAHARSATQEAAFVRRLERALQPLRAVGTIATWERAEYFRETARYGGEDAMLWCESVFESDSDLALSMLAIAHESQAWVDADPLELTVRAFDATAAALGLDLPARRDLARRKHHALGLDPDVRPSRLRADLAQLLTRAQEDAFSAALAAHHDRVAALAQAAPTREALLGALSLLLHLSFVRLCSPTFGVHDEAAAYRLWERAIAAAIARGGGSEYHGKR